MSRLGRRFRLGSLPVFIGIVLGISVIGIIWLLIVARNVSFHRESRRRRLTEIKCPPMGKPSPAAYLPSRFEEHTCPPKYHLGFLKTHRCASSGVQNILFRFAFNHELFSVIPGEGTYVSKEPFQIEDVCLTPSYNLGYHILSLHARWDHAEVQRVLPNNTVFFSIVRDPVAQFTSMFRHLEMDRFTSIDNFAAERPIPDKRISGLFGRNQMLWDFGLDGAHLTDPARIRAKVAEIERQFDLIMIAERMDESLVLLRELLCWPTAYLVTMRLNSLMASDQLPASSVTRERLTAWLEGDYMLYHHFYNVFERRVQKYGVERMRADVKKLQEKTLQVVDACKITRNGPWELQLESRWSSERVYGYQARNKSRECQMLTFSEAYWTDTIRTAQEHLITTGYLES